MGVVCSTLGHPGVTFNPWLDQTWCVCGAVRYFGNQVSHPHMACCGGPLERKTA